jgi:hypothetical protein
MSRICRNRHHNAVLCDLLCVPSEAAWKPQKIGGLVSCGCRSGGDGGSGVGIGVGFFVRFLTFFFVGGSGVGICVVFFVVFFVVMLSFFVGFVVFLSFFFVGGGGGSRGGGIVFLW